MLRGVTRTFGTSQETGGAKGLGGDNVERRLAQMA